MAGVLASASAASAAPIRDSDTAGDASRTTLIQFPKLSFSLGAEADRDWTGGPLPAVADGAARFDALSFHVPSDGLGDKPITAADADSGQFSPHGAAQININAAPRAAAQNRPSAATVPEPASIVLIGLASLLLYFFGRRWSRQHGA